MRVLLVVLLVGIVGCGGDPNKKANALFVESVQLINSAAIKTGDAAIADYDHALANVQQIIDEYGESDLAVKLVSGEMLFAGQTLVEIQARVTTLKEEAERQAELAQSKEELADVFRGTMDLFPADGHLPERQEEERAGTLLTLKGHARRVTSVSFSPDGKRIVSGSWDDTLKVWDAQTGQETLTLKGHSGYVYSVSFSPDGKRIVSCCVYETIVWDAQTGQETLTLEDSDEARSVSFSPDGKRIVMGGGKGVTDFPSKLKVWDAQTGQETLTLKETRIRLTAHQGLIHSVGFSPDGKRIVSGSYETVKVYDAQTGQETLTLKGDRLIVYSVSFSPDGKRIVSGSDNIDRPGEVKVWDAQTGRETLTLDGNSVEARSVSFSPDGKWILSCGGKKLQVWDAQTGRETLTLEDSDYINSVSFSPGGRRVVSGGQIGYKQIVVGTLKVWDISSLATSK